MIESEGITRKEEREKKTAGGDVGVRRVYAFSPSQSCISTVMEED